MSSAGQPREATARPQFRALIDHYLLYRDGDPADADALRAYANRVSIRNFRLLMLLNIGSNLLWWLSDPFTTAQVPELMPGFVRWRLSSIILAAALYWLLGRVRWFERHVALTLTLIFAGFMAINLWSVWPLGGLDTPLPDAGYLVPLVTALALVPLPTRVGLVVLITAGWQITYFFVEPRALDSPYLGVTLALLLFAAFCGAVLGHVTYHLTRENFLISRRLQDFNAGLQSEVERRTRELRALANRVVDLRETERSHLARELHDQSGQLLTGMRLEIDALELRAAQPNQREAVEAGLARLGGLLDALLDGLRRILRDLRPKLLDDLGLPAALGWLARTTSEAGPRSVTAAVDESLDELPPNVAMALFRVAQEALTNAIRHAKASSVALELVREDEAIVLRVTDDGRGLAPEQDHEGLGLLGMHERARSIAGTLTLRPGPDQRGTCVELRVDPRSLQ